MGVGCDYTSQPCSSRPPTEAQQLESPPVVVEDIMDDIETEDQYDAPPAGEFNVDRSDDDGDEDSDGDDGGQDEANNLYVVPAEAFLRQINMNDARADDEDIDNRALNDTQELHIGQRFKDKKSLRRAVKIYSVRVHHTFKVEYSCAKYEEYRCPNYGNGCNWRARVCYRRREGHYEITKYNGPHSCLAATLCQDHPKLDADVISSFIVTMVTENPGVTVAQVIERIRLIFLLYTFY